MYKRMKINHLSVVVNTPEKTAQILADILGSSIKPFLSKTMKGAWICSLDAEDTLIEFLPKGYALYPTPLGANFKPVKVADTFYNATHVQLEVNIPLEHIQKIAESYKCHHYFRPKFGGPLYEVWLEEEFLVEFSSHEIRAMV